MRLIAYRVAVVAAACLLAYVTSIVTLANITASRSPAFALKLQPSHAVAHDRIADRGLMTNPRREEILTAAGHAVAALRRNPTLPGPARILAIRAGLRGNDRAAEQLFSYAATMSRRDIPTQLWLLERRVQQDDINGSLVHYGIILRVAPGMGDVLFPVLTAALSQPYLVRPIARLVRDGGPWTSQFLYHVPQHASDPRHAAALYIELASLGQELTPDHLAPLINSLVSVGAYADAARIYATADRQWRLDDANAQLDGGFTRTGDFAPMGWSYNPSASFKAGRPGGSNNPALYINPPARGTEWAARRLLILPAGRYRITGRFGVQGGSLQGNLRLGLACAPDAQTTSPVEIPVPSAQGLIAGTLATPAGCGSQWLVVAFESDSGGGGDANLWVDDLQLARADR